MEHVKPSFDRVVAVEALTNIILTKNARTISRAILFSIHLFEDFSSIRLGENELKAFQTQYSIFLNLIQNTPLIGSVAPFESNGVDSTYRIVDVLRAIDLSFLEQGGELHTSRVILNTFSYDEDTHQIWNQEGKRISIPEKLSVIFSTLLYKRGIPVTFNELDSHWDLTPDKIHALEQAISSLRKLLDTLHCGIRIKNVYGVGYVLEV